MRMQALAMARDFADTQREPSTDDTINSNTSPHPPKFRELEEGEEVESNNPTPPAPITKKVATGLRNPPREVVVPVEMEGELAVRKKTDEEKAFLKNRVQRGVICKLSRICKHEQIVDEIERSAKELKQCQLEAWHLANVHVLRCLKENLPLPSFDKTFFNRCCAGKIIEISTGEYRHMSKMNHFRAWNESLKKREPWYAGVVHAMPSFKTASYEQYVNGLSLFWMHLRFLLAFYAENPFLKWRFTRDRLKAKALDALAKRIVPKSSSQVCIGYGDWSRRDGIKGHATGPVKGFVEALKKRATVLAMDEFRTSKLCSCCHKHLNQTSLFTKVRQETDGGKKKVVKKPVKLPEKELKKKAKKEAKEKKEMERLKNPKLKDFKIVLKSNRNVLRCENSRCEANFWNWDVNAARNMLELMKGYFQNMGRMTAFLYVETMGHILDTIVTYAMWIAVLDSGELHDWQKSRSCSGGSSMA
ncbi:hypothetical protein P3T76_009834 [Phytophthora citrophthora]|uniref:Uncharacterized protein n=1 Tax=Phytophthora citrophthora TaxID=4793 RepID=A0AAD9LI01_9STRA|nr:hypothetical protein P3T76_009834 [Phytophthora citrophthora]